MGRQPLYDRLGDVVGYELLFRSGPEAVTATSRNAFAASEVIVSAFTEFGLSQLVGDRPCFVNLAREFLVGDLPVPFDPGELTHAYLSALGRSTRTLTSLGDNRHISP